MCVVSMVGDFHGDMFPKKWPDYFPQDNRIPTVIGYPDKDTEAIKADLAQMKKEMMEIKELLRRAKLYDEETGQQDCSKDEKVALLVGIAKALGVDLSDVLPKEA